MFQELADKRPDVIIGLVCGMLTGLACLLVDRSTKGGEPTSPQRITLTQITQVSVKIADQTPAPANVQAITAFGIVAACIAYLRNQDLVLTSAFWAASLLLGLWLGVAIYSLKAGHIGGVRWPLYMMTMMAVLALGIFGVIPSAENPAALPSGVQLPFSQWQPVALEYGVGVLSRQLGAGGLSWLAVHVFGLMVFFVGLKDAALSMVFYAAAGSGRLQRANESSWLARWAARYAHPFRMLLSVTLCTLVAYWFVNGYAFYWWTQDMPALLNHFVQSVLSGQRGS